MWFPSPLTLLRQVQMMGLEVVLRLSSDLAGDPLPTEAVGNVIEVSEDGFTVRVAKDKLLPAAVSDEMSFVHVAYQSDGAPMPIRYSAEAVVTARNGRDLTIRVPHSFRTRRIRRDERLPWDQKFPATMGIAIVESAPKTRNELKQVLARCATEGDRMAFSPLDISAGGMCLGMNPAIARARPGSMLFFLLFFKHEENSKPFFLLCKRLGIRCSGDCGRADGIRLQFVLELDQAQNPSAQLKWQDIERSGSARLRSLLKGLRASQKDPGTRPEQGAR